MQNSAKAANQISVWIPIVASLIGGGLAGAVLNTIVIAYRNRVPPIGYHAQRRFHLFKNKLILSTDTWVKSSNREFVLPDGRIIQAIDGIYLRRFRFSNIGTQDFEEFNFGITLTEHEISLGTHVKVPNRYHVAEVKDIANSNNLVEELDILFKPFNRKDTYDVNIVVKCLKTTWAPKDFKFSTAHSVRFTKL